MSTQETTSPASSRRRFLQTAGVGAIGVAAAGSLSTPAVAQSSDPIIVGGPLPVTGGAAADGIEFQNGLEMAADEINEAGGILGREVQVVIADTQSGGDDVITSAGQRLVDRDNASVLISGYNFGSQTALQNVAADASVIYLHADTSRAHTELVSTQADRFWGSFMYCPSELFYGTAFLNFIKTLEEQGKLNPQNRRVAIATGPLAYSINIANTIRESAAEFGYEVSLFETVEMSTSEWGPVLTKLREDNPGFIAITHIFPGDQAAFMEQFLRNPTNSLVYLQYGASLAAFRDIAGEASKDVLYATNIGALSGPVGTDFTERYLARFGERASPNGGAQTYEALHLYAEAAALAGGAGLPYEEEQNRKVAARLKDSIFRGPTGAIRFNPVSQQCFSYPVETNDPSLGMAHIFSQIERPEENGKIISPTPYDVTEFRLPHWMS